jgi:acyl-CoA synthetase (AMP-forming)/AMP-acid ligase II
MFGENLAIAFRALWANKMRSLLTTLGVVIGVAAVIAVVSIVQGFFFAVNNLFKDLGSGWVRVMAERPQSPGFENRLIPPLRRADADYLLEHASLVQDVAPAMFGGLLRAADQIQADFSSLRICCAGGAPMPVDLLRRFEDRFGVVLIEGDKKAVEEMVLRCHKGPSAAKVASVEVAWEPCHGDFTDFRTVA